MLRHRIQARVSILVAVGMLGPVGALALLNARAGRELERRLLAGGTQSATLMADRLQAQLSLELSSLQGVAEAKSPPAALRELWVRQPALFESLFLLDRDGKLLAQEPRAAPLDPVQGEGFTGLLPSGHALAVARTPAGAVGGVLRLAPLLRNYRPVAGEAMDLVDSAGALLASSNPAHARGEDELVAAAAVPVARWQVAVRQPRAEALGSFAALWREAWMASALSLLLALTFAWGASRSLTRPLSALTGAAGRISKGDLSHPIPPLDEDEVGQLGEALERMRASLLQAREAAVRKLLGQVIRAQEDERRRVARELHDETTQNLTTLVMRLQTTAARVPPGELNDRLLGACALAERTLDGVHRLIVDLRPAVLDDLGLAAAIRWFAETRLKGVAARCEFSGLEARLPPQTETVVFRVAQEALTNVLRHAQATSVLVQCSRRDGQLSLEIEDDGRGFDPRAVKGWGLLGMRERVEMLGGELRLDSAPGEGTHVAVTVPLEAPHAAR